MGVLSLSVGTWIAVSDFNSGFFERGLSVLAIFLIATGLLRVFSVAFESYTARYRAATIAVVLWFGILGASLYLKSTVSIIAFALLFDAIIAWISVKLEGEYGY